MSLLDVTDDAGGQDGRQLGAALLRCHRGGVGGVDDDAARGHRHLSEEAMPTTFLRFAASASSGGYGLASASLYQLHTRSVNLIVNEFTQSR